MSHMEQHTRWFRTITGNDSGRAAAAKSGMSVATVNRQLAREELSAEMVIAIARGYGQSPVTALVETGYLEAGEANNFDMVDSPRLLTDQQLIRELARRVDSNEDAWAGTFDEVVESSATVTTGPWASMSDLPVNVAAHIDDEKGVPDIPSEAEESQDPGEEDFDPA